MAGLINFGLLDPNLPQYIMNAPARAQKEQTANALAQAQLAHSQDQSALARYTISKAQREDQTQAGLLADLKAGKDPVATYTHWGQPDKAIKMQSDQMGLEKGKIEKALKLTELWKHYGDSVYADPTEENAIMATMEAAKVAGADPTQAVAKIKAMGGDPALIKKWAASHALTAKEMAPKLANFNAGGTQAFVSQDPQSGELLGRTDVPRTMSPESVASNERIRQEGALNRGVQMRGQNMTDTRMRESYQSGGTGGKAPTGYKWAADGETLEPIPGGPKDPVNLNLAGGRESTQINRVITGGNQAAASLQNLVRLPMTTSRGIFGGRGQKEGLFSAGVETLAQTMTTQDVQSYNVLTAGIQRSLAAIEASGLAPNMGLTHQMDAVVWKEGWTNFTKLQALAEIRQIVEKGMEVVISNPRVSKEQKDLVEKIVKDVHGAVPFSNADLLTLQEKQQVDKGITLNDVMKRRGSDKSWDDSKEQRYQELLRKRSGAK